VDRYVLLAVTAMLEDCLVYVVQHASVQFMWHRPVWQIWALVFGC